MMTREQMIEALQEHLRSAEILQTSTHTFRQPVAAIECGDGTRFSIQAGKYMYCSPRDDLGPWETVEVMTLTDGVEPKFWEHDQDTTLAGYVPITAVADEILLRGNFVSMNQRG
jgi:hypothetical protein